MRPCRVERLVFKSPAAVIASVVLNRSTNSGRGNRRFGFGYSDVVRSGRVAADISLQAA
jgi:hypothetical protein